MMQVFGPLSGHREKHMNTLCAMMCGIIGSKHTHLPTVADNVPTNGARQESLIKRFKRWVQHDAHSVDGWFSPIAQQVLTVLAPRSIQIVMDGSVVGRGCIALLLSVVYHGRALPLCWVVVQGKKGHFPQDTHRALLAQLSTLMPPHAQVTFLGDGEFDGTELQADLRQYGWAYVCRTASNIRVQAHGVTFHVADLGPPCGEVVAVTPAWMTDAAYGPISILAVWEHGYEAPIYLVTNMTDLDDALAQYRKRAHVETFFSDQKSRGFHIHKSHLSDPQRLSRLLIAACLAYLWIVYLGVCAVRDDWMRLIHREDRCDLSLFRLGLRLLSRCLNDHIPIPDGFLVPADLPAPLMRSAMKKAA
jgi:hypothetical protein